MFYLFGSQCCSLGMRKQHNNVLFCVYCSDKIKIFKQMEKCHTYDTCPFDCMRGIKTKYFCKFSFMKKCIFFTFSGYLLICGNNEKKLKFFFSHLIDQESKFRNFFSKDALKKFKRTLLVFTKKNLYFNPSPY